VSNTSLAILGMVLITWIGGGALALLEETQGASGRRLLSVVLAGLGLSFVVALLAWFTFAAHLASIASFQPANLDQLLASASSVAATLTLFYGWVGVLVLGTAWTLYSATAPAAAGRVTGRSRGLANRSVLAVTAYIALPVLVIFLSLFLNLKNIQADIVYKTGLQFDDGGQPLAAIPLFKLSLTLAPGEDYYYLFLGRAYLNATAQQTDPTQRDQLLAEAQSQLQEARKLNPLNTDHTANLARLNRRWAELATDATVKAQHAQASDMYYSQAVVLSPNNAGLWNEWAALEFQVEGDQATAQQHLDQSFKIDSQFDQTYLLQGDLYSTEARAAATISDTAAAKALYDKAILSYQTGITGTIGASSLSNLRINLASAYVGDARPQDAINIYQQMLADNDASVSQWQIYLALSQLYVQVGNVDQARINGQLALQNVPSNDATDLKAVQDWISKLP
jgi:tetratricopeptide (TPR) repeat protein